MEKHGGVEGHGGGLHGGVLESIKGGVHKCTEGHHGGDVGLVRLGLQILLEHS